MVSERVKFKEAKNRNIGASGWRGERKQELLTMSIKFQFQDEQIPETCCIVPAVSRGINNTLRTQRSVESRSHVKCHYDNKTEKEMGGDEGK